MVLATADFRHLPSEVVIFYCCPAALDLGNRVPALPGLLLCDPTLHCAAGVHPDLHTDTQVVPKVRQGFLGVLRGAGCRRRPPEHRTRWHESVLCQVSAVCHISQCPFSLQEAKSPGASTGEEH